MKRTYVLNLLKVILVSISFLSCERYVDTTPPVIENFYINGNDGSGSEPEIDTLSTELEIRSYLTDDNNLLSYSITFEPKEVITSGLRVPAFLDQVDTFPIAGAQTEIYKILKIATAPDSEGSYVAATGDYEIHLDAKDVGLNEADRATIAMEFRNYAPFFKFDDNILEDTIEFNKGVTLPINYVLDDLDDNINALTMQMYEIVEDPSAVEDEESDGNIIHIFPVDVPTPGNNPFDYNESYVFADTGTYELRIKANDQRRNETNAIIVIKVTE